jgi:hypothetical protein
VRINDIVIPTKEHSTPIGERFP